MGLSTSAVVGHCCSAASWAETYLRSAVLRFFTVHGVGPFCISSWTRTDLGSLLVIIGKKLVVQYPAPLRPSFGGVFLLRHRSCGVSSCLRSSLGGP